jgi:hypothetical protein
MDIEYEIQDAKGDPERLEQLYQVAQKEDQGELFKSAVSVIYEEEPENMLIAAWFYRLQQALGTEKKASINWQLAVPLSILTGLIFWLLSDIDNLVYLDHLPYLILWWSPIAAMSALIFLSFTAKRNQFRAVLLGIGLFAITGYAMLVAPGLDVPWKINHYLDLSAIHIPLLCWAALGVSVLGFRSGETDRFAFLIKSIEVIITAGLYLIAGVVLGAITVGMFAALSIDIPEIWLRLIIAGGFGLLPVLAVASVYDPTVDPAQQDFSQGLSRFIATMMRLLLPLTLGVLVIYLIVIPFYFFEPFNNRDVLIVYNLMLFAIMALLLGATPISGVDLSPQLQKWLRRGIISVAILAGLISLYALSATIFRTVEGGWTINRLTIIGWNTINILILIWLTIKQFRSSMENWIDSSHSAFSSASIAYMVWGLFVVLVIPWLIR